MNMKTGDLMRQVKGVRSTDSVAVLLNGIYIGTNANHKSIMGGDMTTAHWHNAVPEYAWKRDELMLDRFMRGEGGLLYPRFLKLGDECVPVVSTAALFTINGILLIVSITRGFGELTNAHKRILEMTADDYDSPCDCING